MSPRSVLNPQDEKVVDPLFAPACISTQEFASLTVIASAVAVVYDVLDPFVDAVPNGEVAWAPRYAIATQPHVTCVDAVIVTVPFETSVESM